MGWYRFEQNFIDMVLDRTNIVELIGRYVDLKRTGENYKGLCPFHSEKTPSFIVNENKGIFKCFGCGESGNAISFLMKHENMSFADAMKKLCDDAHIDLPEARRLTEEEKKKIEKISRQIQLHTELARFYFGRLQENADESKAYLKNRGISEKYIRKFGLGYETGDSKSRDYLQGKGFSQEELLESMIFRKKDDRVYCIFFRRVMFPIFDKRGRVIAFGGRTIDKKGEPKYLNSPESIIFSKKHNLYGLNFVIKDRADKIVLSEGYMDVISLVQHGVKGAVASLGTSLTTQQANLIKAYNKKVYICYDGDSAGIKATQRAIKILNSVGISPYIISLTDAKDPDEFFLKHDLSDFKQIVKDALTPLTFEIETLKNGYDLQIFTQKQEFIQKAALMIKASKDPIEKEYQTKKLADMTDTSIKAVGQLVYDYFSYRRFDGYDKKKLPERVVPNQKQKKNTNEEILLNMLKENVSLSGYISENVRAEDLQDEELKAALQSQAGNDVEPVSEDDKALIDKLLLLIKLDALTGRIEQNNKTQKFITDLGKLDQMSKECIELIKQRERLKIKIKGMI